MEEGRNKTIHMMCWAASEHDMFLNSDPGDGTEVETFELEFS